MLAVVLRDGRIFYGWWIALGVVVATTVGSGLTFWTFTVYIPPLEEAFGWSRGEVSGAFSLGLLVAGLASPLAGRTLDRFGARRSIAFGTVATAGSFLLLSRVDTLWEFYAAYMLHSLARTWMLFIPVQWLLAQWFDRRRGAAMGLATAGFGLGGVIFLPVVELMVRGLGWSASFALSAAITAAAFLPLVALVFHDRPADLGLRPDGAEPVSQRWAGPAAPSGRQWTTAEAVRSPVFWSLSLAFLLFFSAQVSFMVHAIPFFESAGISASQGAAVLSYMAILLTVGRLASGVFVDRLPDLRSVAIGVSGLQALALLLLTASTGMPAIVGFAILWGLGGSAGPMLEPLMVARTFGTRSFGTILGTMLLVETVGDIAGPLLGGILFDALGSYTVPFFIYIGFYAASAVTFLLAGRALRRAEEPVSQ